MKFDRELKLKSLFGDYTELAFVGTIVGRPEG